MESADMTLMDWIIAAAIIIPWNAFLIYRMIQEDKKHAADNNTSNQEE